MHIALEASKTNRVMSQLEEGLNTYPSQTVTEKEVLTKVRQLRDGIDDDTRCILQSYF